VGETRNGPLILPAVLPQVSQLLTDEAFRRPHVEAVAGMPALKSFWTGYDALGDAARAQIIAPLMNKLRAFLLRDYVANLVGSTTSSFDMETVLDGGVLLARLPKGVLGEETSRLLGSFVVASVWQAATARARRGQDARVDAALYVDECQNFLTLPRSFEEMLAEARGYRLSLVLAHQHLGQLPRDLKEAVAANARTKVYFSLSPDDARVLAKHTAPDLSEYDLSHLPAYTAAVRLLRDGQELPACTVATLPAATPTGKATAVRKAARENWGRTPEDRRTAAGPMDGNADLPR
jgi:hypothetical protein